MVIKTNLRFSGSFGSIIRTTARNCDCGRQAKFYSKARRRWRTNDDHYLCRQCWQSKVDSHRTR